MFPSQRNLGWLLDCAGGRCRGLFPPPSTLQFDTSIQNTKAVTGAKNVWTRLSGCWRTADGWGLLGRKVASIAATMPHVCPSGQTFVTEDKENVYRDVIIVRQLARLDVGKWVTGCLPWWKG